MKTPAAEILLDLATKATLFHTPDGDLFASMPAAGHHETHAISSRAFRRWLAREYWLTTGKAAPPDALRQAVVALEGQAQFDGEEHPVYVRVAPAQDGLYLDLADSRWRNVHVDATGWRIVERAAPVRFRRAAGMLALPAPEHGGDLAELGEFVNVEGGTTSTAFSLLVGWLVGALRYAGPFLVLMLLGEQGSGKSWLGRILRALIDPNQVPLRAQPRDLRDVAVGANNAWVLGLDNLSGVSDWLSDALCRLSTGGGFATRALYTDSEEAIFDAQRPIILNGIDSVGSRGDLLDRAVILNLPRIQNYRPEAELWADFEAARPRLLGALLDAVSMALANENRVRLARSVRMADAARWVVAAEPALPWPRGRFLEAYAVNRDNSNHLAIEGSLVAMAVVKMNTAFQGSATQLKAALEAVVGEKMANSRDWPKAPKTLSGRLRRAAPNLRAVGWHVEFLNDGKRTITLTPPDAAGDRQHRQHRQEIPEAPENAAPSGSRSADDTSARPSGPSGDRQPTSGRQGNGNDGPDDTDDDSHPARGLDPEAELPFEQEAPPPVEDLW